jgi:uncharacterized protein
LIEPIRVAADDAAAGHAAEHHGPVRPAAALVRRYRSYVLPLLYVGSAFWHWRQLSGLWNARRGSMLERLVVSRPEIWSLLRVRFVAAPWTAKTRFRRIVDHCEIVDAMGRPFDIKPNESAVLMRLDEIDGSALLVLDCARWLFREGLLALNIVEGRDRLFSLSFTLATGRDGRRIAYVGGIQGRRGGDALARNRAFTKAALGTRPQDMLVELFRGLCAAAGVSQILCVSDRIRNGRTAFAYSHADYADPVTFDYDTLWRERGGVLRDDGFFDLPLAAPVRDEAEVPAKKRQARRKKLALIEQLKLRLGVQIAHPALIRVEQVEPV